MATLFKIEHPTEETNDYLIFDTDVPEPDLRYIKESWNEIRKIHPEWGRTDCIGELIETYLPKRGLNAEYTWSQSITLK